jgi:hypothetical protein
MDWTCRGGDVEASGGVSGLTDNAKSLADYVWKRPNSDTYDFVSNNVNFESELGARDSSLMLTVILHFHQDGQTG